MFHNGKAKKISNWQKSETKYVFYCQGWKNIQLYKQFQISLLYRYVLWNSSASRRWGLSWGMCKKAVWLTVDTITRLNELQNIGYIMYTKTIVVGHFSDKIFLGHHRKKDSKWTAIKTVSETFCEPREKVTGTGFSSANKIVFADRKSVARDKKRLNLIADQGWRIDKNTQFFQFYFEKTKVKNLSSQRSYVFTSEIHNWKIVFCFISNLVTNLCLILEINVDWNIELVYNIIRHFRLKARSWCLEISK